MRLGNGWIVIGRTEEVAHKYRSHLVYIFVAVLVLLLAKIEVVLFEVCLFGEMKKVL